MRANRDIETPCDAPLPHHSSLGYQPPAPDTRSRYPPTVQWSILMDRNFKRAFLWMELYRSPGRVVNSRLCLMKTHYLYWSAWPQSSREASERSLMIRSVELRTSGSVGLR